MTLQWWKANVRWMAWTLVLVALLASGAYVVYQKHQWAAQQLLDLEPRYARMLGLQRASATTQKSEQELLGVVTRYSYPAGMELTKAGNDAQQRVREAFSKSGLDVLSSQVLAPKQDKLFERIPLSLRAEGELAALQSALILIRSGGPVVLVDSVAMQTIGVFRPDQSPRLAIQLELFVLRAKP